jgi:hypothetical protein
MAVTAGKDMKNGYKKTAVCHPIRQAPVRCAAVPDGSQKAALNHVVFLNVIERDKVAMRRGKGYEKSAEVRLREKANIRFIDWAETLFEQGMEVGVYIVVGSFAGQVIQAAEKESVSI